MTGEQFRDPGPVEVVQFGRETAEAAPCVYRKSKSERIDDEVRPVWRANL